MQITPPKNAIIAPRKWQTATEVSYEQIKVCQNWGKNSICGPKFDILIKFKFSPKNRILIKISIFLPKFDILVKIRFLARPIKNFIDCVKSTPPLIQIELSPYAIEWVMIGMGRVGKPKRDQIELREMKISSPENQPPQKLRTTTPNPAIIKLNYKFSTIHHKHEIYTYNIQHIVYASDRLLQQLKFFFEKLKIFLTY